MMDINGLSKAYGSKIVLRDIHLSFEGGKVYGIVGDNGSGKTTLFRCITGIEACFGDIRCNKIPLKDHIGFLPTEPFYFSKMTGREYLQLLCNARKTQTGDLDQRNVFDLPLDQYASTYSTGMKKKLAFMGILIQPNDIFILDEPFNGVDIHSNILITEILHRLKASGKMVIISSHIFSTLRDNCDVIHHLHAGQITRSVLREEFNLLEQDLQTYTIGARIEHLGM